MPASPLLRTLAAGAAAVLALAPITRADEFTDRANALYRNISQAKRSDLIVLPALAKMQPPPAAVAAVEKAIVLPATSAAFQAARDWAAAEPQQAVLAALDQVTKEENPVEAFAFAQPYGSEALAATPEGLAMVRAGLYTDLGDPPMLAGARFLYIPALDNAASLVHVEATRLAAEGNFDKAFDILIDWLFFSRQMVDRAFFQEARWGWRSMIVASDRLRDLVYTDFRGTHKITNDQIAAVLTRIRPEGYISIDRAGFPGGNRIAAEQVVARVFIERDGVNEAVFGTTMARLAATQRPLRLFAEAARWSQAAAGHGNWTATSEQLKKVYGDLASRWPLDAFDPRLAYITDLESMPRGKYAVLVAITPDMTVLLNDRQVLRTQLVGTRCALGLMAFQNRNKNLAPDLASIRPTWVRDIEADPFNPDRAAGRHPPLEYFVPKGPSPHEINVVTRGGQYNFRARVGQDQFVLYSVGPDGAKQRATLVSGEPPKGANGDLLLWPPVISLLRQRQLETGELK